MKEPTIEQCAKEMAKRSPEIVQEMAVIRRLRLQRLKDLRAPESIIAREEKLVKIAERAMKLTK